ncbi:hydrogenase maturation peptidase HycI [Candidatus Bathyarchaeota archaeon]|nr:MAG: hydrogenase maturation peptidase HycI [Candidatus Bathyarchaeota archaeon]
MDSQIALCDQLYAWLRGCRRLVILGIGNPLRGDDAVGLKVIQNLSGRIPGNVLLLECGMVPENYLSKIEEFNPTHVLMIDAAHLKEEAGASRLISIEEIAGTALSTHTLPLSFLAEIIKQNIGADVKLLGIQPESIEFKEGLSPKLQEVSRKIADLLMKIVKEAFQDEASNKIREKRFSC